MPGSGPCRRSTRARNRAVFVAGRLARGAVLALPLPGRCGLVDACSGEAGWPARRLGATGHSAMTQARNPDSVEAGARTSRSTQRISPPRTARGVVSSSASPRPLRLVTGDRPGPDDPDQGVRRQRIRDRRHRPDGEAPPARRRGDRVHEHARADRRQVQEPGADRAAAVQSQRDTQAGEHQGGGVRDRCFQPGDNGQPARGVDHPVLRGETHRSRCAGQDGESGGGIAQPGSGPVAGGGIAAGVAARKDDRALARGSARVRGPVHPAVQVRLTATAG